MNNRLLTDYTPDKKSSSCLLKVAQVLVLVADFEQLRHVLQLEPGLPDFAYQRVVWNHRQGVRVCPDPLLLRVREHLGERPRARLGVVRKVAFVHKVGEVDLGVRAALARLHILLQRDAHEGIGSVEDRVEALGLRCARTGNRPA